MGRSASSVNASPPVRPTCRAGTPAARARAITVSATPAATVLSESFRGKSRVQQHQIVYEALKAEMGGKLHALALQTGTPEQ